MAAIPIPYVSVTTRDLIMCPVHLSACQWRAWPRRRQHSITLRRLINLCTDDVGKPWDFLRQMTPCHTYEKFYLTIRKIIGTSRHLVRRKAGTVRNISCNVTKSERVKLPMIRKTKEAISRSDRVL